MVLHIWGFNEVNNLSIGTATNQLAPTLVQNIISNPLFSNFVKIACNMTTIVAITSTNQIFTWGTNASCCGTGDWSSSAISYARNITTVGSFNGATIVDIICAGSFTLALDSTGALHGFGSGPMGGMTTTSFGNYFNGALTIPCLINAIQANSFGQAYSSLYGKTIVKAGCCSSSAFAIDSTGGLHSWGTNSTGKLFDGSTTDQNVPIIAGNF